MSDNSKVDKITLKEHRELATYVSKLLVRAYKADDVDENSDTSEFMEVFKTVLTALDVALHHAVRTEPKEFTAICLAYIRIKVMENLAPMYTAPTPTPNPAPLAPISNDP